MRAKRVARARRLGRAHDAPAERDVRRPAPARRRGPRPRDGAEHPVWPTSPRAISTPTTSREIMGLFDELHAAGHTIVLVTHEHDIAMHARRIITFRDGKVAEDIQQPTTDSLITMRSIVVLACLALLVGCQQGRSRQAVAPAVYDSAAVETRRHRGHRRRRRHRRARVDRRGEVEGVGRGARTCTPRSATSWRRSTLLVEIDKRTPRNAVAADRGRAGGGAKARRTIAKTQLDRAETAVQVADAHADRCREGAARVRERRRRRSWLRRSTLENARITWRTPTCARRSPARSSRRRSSPAPSSRRRRRT